MIFINNKPMSLDEARDLYSKYLYESGAFSFPSRKQAWERQACICCGEKIDRDKLDEKEREEYGISALCGGCYDELARQDEHLVSKIEEGD